MIVIITITTDTETPSQTCQHLPSEHGQPTFSWLSAFTCLEENYSTGFYRMKALPIIQECESNWPHSPHQWKTKQRPRPFLIDQEGILLTPVLNHNSHSCSKHHSVKIDNKNVLKRWVWPISFRVAKMQIQFMLCSYFTVITYNTNLHFSWSVYCTCTLPSVLWHCWLGGRKGIRPVKNWVVGCWRGYLSAARCRLAYGPADATATHCLLLQ